MTSVFASNRTLFTPTLQKLEDFRVKASGGEVVVLYFKPSATQNLKSSGFPEGSTTWLNRPHPSNSPMEVSNNLSFYYYICNNCRPLSDFYHVVYATKGFIRVHYTANGNAQGPSSSGVRQLVLDERNPLTVSIPAE